jgi:hypothetical protein
VARGVVGLDVHSLPFLALTSWNNPGSQQRKDTTILIYCQYPCGYVVMRNRKDLPVGRPKRSWTAGGR